MPVFNYELADDDDNANFGDKKKFEPLKPGTYQAMVVATRVKRTKKDDGEYVELEFQITDGPSAGRRTWERYNLINPNKKTMAMAAKQLGWVCSAVGVKIKEMKSTEQLHDIPVNLVLDIDRQDPTKNRISACHPISSAQKPPQSSTKKPWERG